MPNYTFTEDWFSSRIPTLKKHVGALIGKPIRYLEIGVFEGRSTVWQLENVLTHPDSKATCIDPFYQRNGVDMYKRFLDNVSSFGKVTALRGKSQDLLRTLTDKFDLIYIDGDHTAAAVLEDAVLSFSPLESGGILIFDDYPWSAAPYPHLRPKIAIDAFLEIYQDKIKILEKGWQVFIKKL